MTEKKHNYFYKITNKINGKFYYGIRSTDKEIETDRYWGSGRAIRQAIEKYGIENFKKEILMDYPTRLEVNLHEERIVTWELINNIHCYNLKTGGDNKGKCLPSVMQGKRHTDETKKLMSLKAKGRIISQEQRIKNGLKHKGKTMSPESRKLISLNCTHRKECSIDGQFYHSIGFAAKSLNVTATCIRKRILSYNEKWKEWKFL